MILSKQELKRSKMSKNTASALIEKICSIAPMATPVISTKTGGFWYIESIDADENKVILNAANDHAEPTVHVKDLREMLENFKDHEVLIRTPNGDREVRSTKRLSGFVMLVVQ